jgi:hypothetical protein
MAFIQPYPTFRAWDPGTGGPLVGGLLYSYIPGTDTAKYLYTDRELTIPHSNPVVLDSNGESNIYLNGSTKLVLKTALGALVWTLDNLVSPVDDWIFAIEYGSPSQTTIETAIAAIGSDNRTLIITPGTWDITTSLTIPSNITLRVDRGATLTIADTKTLTINGGFEAGLYQVFTDNNTAQTGVVFGTGAVKEIPLQWWGGVAGDSGAGQQTANRKALQSACNAIASGQAIHLTAGAWYFGTTTVTVDHTASGGASSNYTATAKLVGKSNVKLFGEGVITESAGPTAYIQWLVLQNVQDSEFRYKYQGAYILTDAMDNSTNPLEITGGCEVLYFTDNCFRNRLVAWAKSVRTPAFFVNYDKAGTSFNEANKPRYVQAEVFVEDTDYGIRYSGTDHTQTRITGKNVKRIYRLDASHHAQAWINTRVEDKWSWDEYSHHVYLNAGTTTRGIQNVNLDIVSHNVPANILSVSAYTNNTGWIKNVNAKINITGKGCVFFEGQATDVGAAQVIENVNVTGNIATDYAQPFYFQVSGNVLNGNVFRRFNFHDLNIQYTGAAIYTPFRFDNADYIHTRYEDFQIKNINIASTSDGTELAYGFKKGCFYLKNHLRPIVSGINNVVTGLAANDPLVGFATCANIEYWGDYKAGFYHTSTTWRQARFQVANSNTTVSTSGIGEDDLQSTVLPLRMMGRTGGIRIKAAGTKTGAAGNKTVKLYFGTDSFTVLPAANNENDWYVEAEVVTTDSNANRMSWRAWDGTTITQGYEAFNEDTTAEITVKLTGECANGADTISQTMWSIERF